MQGDVSALSRRLAEARDGTTAPSEVLDELAALASSYDMKAVRELLRPHTELVS